MEAKPSGLKIPHSGFADMRNKATQFQRLTKTRKGIVLTSPSFRDRAQDDQGFASGDEISDVIGSAASLSEEFKLWLSRHPGLTIEEALHRYRE